MDFIDSYQEIKKTKPAGLRSFLRNKALDVFSLANKITSSEKQLKKPRVQFIYLHHVFKDEEKALRLLLKDLAKDHTFISYSEGVSRLLSGEIDKPYICISSDDGFKNNLTAANILKEFNAPACFFINPSVIGELSFDKLKAYCRTRLNFPPVAFLNWNEIEQMQLMGHEIGSHTMHHINVAATSIDDFKNDCDESIEIIKSKCGDVKHFAFPYGRFFHFNDKARKAVFEAGFISCATAERGCHAPHLEKISTQDLCILRDHIILDWNLNHIRYFLINNSKKVNFQNNLFPY